MVADWGQTQYNCHRRSISQKNGCMRGKRHKVKKHKHKCKHGAKAARGASKEWSARNNVLQIEKRRKTQRVQSKTTHADEKTLH